MDWNLAGAVVLSGLSIVFLVLVLLIAFVWVVGKIGRSQQPQKAESAPAPAATKAAPAPPTVQDGISEETVAVIAAAVAATVDTASPGAAFEIASIQRARSSRPVWGFAGMQQNTRPF